MVQILNERPPFVTFETRPVEDREASIKAGCYVGRDIDYAIITPAGSKDRIERVVTDWFAKLRDDVDAQRIPSEWVSHFKQKYDDYKAGRETPVNGTPVRDWPGVSPSMLKTLHSLHLLAIEDVANANEEAIARLGMGGRSLKQRAIDFLATAKDVGKAAEQLSAMRLENTQLRDDVQRLTEAVRILQASQGQSTPRPADDNIGLGDLLEGATKL